MTRRKGRLLYDSARTCTRLDARSAAGNDRMLVFHSDKLCVDITIQPGPNDLHFIYGQIIHDAPGTPVAGAQVRLSMDADPVTTDEFGQFSATSSKLDASGDIRIETEQTVMVCRIPNGCQIVDA